VAQKIELLKVKISEGSSYIFKITAAPMMHET